VSGFAGSWPERMLPSGTKACCWLETPVTSHKRIRLYCSIIRINLEKQMPARKTTAPTRAKAPRAAAPRPKELMPLAPAKRIRGTASSRKVLQVLTSFTPDRPIATVDAIAKGVKVPLSTAYRYIALLREVGLVTDDGRGGYHLSPRMVELARASRAAFSFIDVALPVMEKLRDASGESVILVRRVGEAAICIERAESAQRVRLSFEVGASYPLHRGASPKLLLDDDEEPSLILSMFLAEDVIPPAVVKQEVIHSDICEAENCMTNVPVFSRAAIPVCPRSKFSPAKKRAESRSHQFT
jgi:hypothetical protein